MNSNIGPWNDFELVLPKGIRRKGVQPAIEEFKISEEVDQTTKMMDEISLETQNVP